MERFKHLMVGLTRREQDASLLRYSAMVARFGFAREIRLMHVLPSAASAHGAGQHDLALADLKQLAAQHFLSDSMTAQVNFDVLKGPLLDRFLEYVAEQESDLAIVGHGPGRSGRHSLARRLAMKAPCSVWMVPENTAPQIRRILVPTDFSEHSADTLQVASSIAARCNAECLALHVYFNEAPVTFEGYDELLRGEEERAYEQFIAGINLHGIRPQPLFVEGANIGHTICRVAEEQQADLVAMPCRGRSRSAAILLGSVAEETIIETKLPLLIVKHFGAKLGLLQVLLDRSFRSRKGPRVG